METIAIHKYARSSAQKVRLIADQIRGLRVSRALDILNFSTKKAAHLVRKVLNSFVSLIVPALTESSGIDFLWKCSINFPEPRSGGLLVVKVINSLREPRSGGLFVKNTYFYSSGFK